MLKKKVGFFRRTGVNQRNREFTEYGKERLTNKYIGAAMQSQVHGTRVVRMGNLIWVEFRRLEERPIAAAECRACESVRMALALGLHPPQIPASTGPH
jgi:hypothetical protein